MQEFKLVQSSKTKIKLSAISYVNKLMTKKKINHGTEKL